jgi:uncharacterized protein (UPF0128 family)
MIFNTRKIIKKTVDDLVLHIKPLNAIQQAEVLDLLQDMTSNSKIVNIAHIAMDYAVDAVEGLFNEDGQEVKVPRNEVGELSRDFVNGLNIATLHKVVQEIAHAGNLEEHYAKKSQ